MAKVIRYFMKRDVYDIQIIINHTDEKIEELEKDNYEEISKEQYDNVVG